MPRLGNKKTHPILGALLGIIFIFAVVAQMIENFISNNPTASIIILFTVISIAAILLYNNYQNKQFENNPLLEAKVLKEFEVTLMSIVSNYQNNGIPEFNDTSTIAHNKGDKLYSCFQNIEWNEVRKVRTGNVVAHGITGRVKLVPGIYYRFGKGKFNSESIDSLETIDSGNLYVTSSGLIFNGQIGSKKILFKDIIAIRPALNGFNFDRTTGKKVFIHHESYVQEIKKRITSDAADIFNESNISYFKKLASLIVLWDNMKK